MHAPSPPEVIVTGYAGVDFIARIHEAVTPGWTGIIERPWDGPTFGGCAPNVAVALARVGIKTAVAMVLGDDEDGRHYIVHLQREGVETRFIPVVAGHPTPRTFLFVPPDGTTSLFFDPGAAAHWTGSFRVDFSRAQLAVLTVGPPAHNTRFAEQAIAAGVPLAWQLKGDLTAYPPELLPRFVARSRLIFMNRQEADYLCRVVGTPSPGDLVSRGPQAIFITRGGEGSEVVTSEGTFPVRAAPATVVDSTGAGDAYTAGVIAGVLQGWALQDAARLGAVLAAFVVEAWGCQTALPTRDAALTRYATVFGPVPNSLSSPHRGEGQGEGSERSK